MKHVSNLIILLILGIVPTLSQTVAVTGKLIDKQHSSIPFASVALLKKSDNTLIAQTQSDTAGVFKLQHLKPGNYLLKVSYIGYLDMLLEVPLSDTIKQKYLGQILLNSDNKTLQEIMVSGKRPVIQQTGNKLSINLSQSNALSGVSTFDMLKRLPGISSGQNGQLLMRGSSGINIVIDGKSTFLTGDQLSNMLSGMPADNISKVEIMTTPAANMDANGNTGTINITTKKTTIKGYSLDLSSGFGKSNKNTFFSNNINGNYNTGKLNVYAMMDVSSKHRHFLNTGQSYMRYNNEQFLYDRVSDRPIKTVFYTYKVGADWNINPKNVLEFSFDGYLDDWSLNSESNALLYGKNSLPAFRSRTNIITKEPYYYNTIHSKYLYRIDSLGKKISVDADYIGFSNHSDGEVSNTFEQYSNNQELSSSKFKFRQPKYIDIFSGRADAELPFQKITLKTGIKYTHAKVNNPINYWNFNGLNYQPDEDKTDNYRYNEQIAATYISAQKKWEHTIVDVGLRYEHTFASQQGKQIDTTWNYGNFFPTLTLTQNLNENHKLDLSVARRINRPTYTDLNPTKWFYDANYYTSGTPGLQPEFSWNTVLNYTFRDKYILQFGYTRRKNIILKELQQDDNGLIISRDNNFPFGNRWDASIIIPVKVTSFWELTGIFNGAYSELPVPMSANQLKLFSRFSGNFVVNQQIKLPLGIGLELSARYNTGELEGFIKSFSTFSFDGGLNKKFLNNRFSTVLSFSDLFFTDKQRLVSVSDLVYYRLKSNLDSRRAFLSLKYHFGGSLKKTSEHQSDEKNRL